MILKLLLYILHLYFYIDIDGVQVEVVRQKWSSMAKSHPEGFVRKEIQGKRQG